MKNMIEVPTKNDFHRTTNIEITSNEIGLREIHYRNCNVAMRSITDFTSIEMEVDVLDNEKMPEYEKQLSEFKENIKKFHKGELNLSERHEHIERPEPPIKKVKISGTMVAYFNGTARIIVDHFEDFETIYFDYLTKQKLDILKSN